MAEAIVSLFGKVKLFDNSDNDKKEGLHFNLIVLKLDPNFISKFSIILQRQWIKLVKYNKHSLRRFNVYY